MLQVNRIDLKTGQTLLENIDGNPQTKQHRIQHSYLEYRLQTHGVETQVFLGKFHKGVDDADRQRLEADGKVAVWTNGKDAYFTDANTARLMAEGDPGQGITPIYAADRNSPHNLVAYGSLVSSNGIASTAMPQSRILVIDNVNRAVGEFLRDRNGTPITPDEIEKLLDKMGDGTMLVSPQIMLSLIQEKEKEEIVERVCKKAGIEVEELAQHPRLMEKVDRQIEQWAERTVTQFRAAALSLPGIAKGTMGTSQWCKRLGVDAILSSDDIKGDDKRFSTPGIKEVENFWVNRKSDAQYSRQAVGPQVQGCISEATLHEFNPLKKVQAEELASVVSDFGQLRHYYIQQKERQQVFSRDDGNLPDEFEGDEEEPKPVRSDWLYEVLKADPYQQFAGLTKINREFEKFSKGAWLFNALHGVSIPSAMAQHHDALRPWEVCNKDLPHGAIVAYYRSPFPNVGAAAIAINNTESLQQADPEAHAKVGVSYLNRWTAKYVAITDYDGDTNGYFVGYEATVPDLPQQIREQLADLQSRPPGEQYEAGRALFERMIRQLETGKEHRIHATEYPLAVKEFIERNAPDQKPLEVSKATKIKHPWNEDEAHSSAIWRAFLTTADNPTGMVANVGMKLQSLALELLYAPQKQKEALLRQVSSNCYKLLQQNEEEKFFIPTDEWLEKQKLPSYNFVQRMKEMGDVVPKLNKIRDPSQKQEFIEIQIGKAFHLLWDAVEGPNARNLQAAVDTAKSSQPIDQEIHAFVKALAHKDHTLREHYKDSDLFLKGKALPTNTQEPISWGVESVNALYRDNKLPERQNSAFRDLFPKVCTPQQEAIALHIARSYNQLIRQAVSAKEKLSQKQPEDQQPTLLLTTGTGKQITTQLLQDSPDLPIWRANGEQTDWKVAIKERNLPPDASQNKRFPVELTFPHQGQQQQQLLGYVAPESAQEIHLSNYIKNAPNRILATDIATAQIRPPFAQQNDVDDLFTRAEEYISDALAQIPKEERPAYLSALMHSSDGMGFALKFFTPEVCDRLQSVPDITLIGLHHDTNQAGAIPSGEYVVRFTQYSYEKNGETRTTDAIAIVSEEGEEKQYGAIPDRGTHLPIGTTVDAQITVAESGKTAQLKVLGLVQTSETEPTEQSIEEEIETSSPLQIAAERDAMVQSANSSSYSPSRQELRQWCAVALIAGNEPLKEHITQIGVQLKAMYGVETGHPGATPPIDYRHPQVVISEGDRQQMQHSIDRAKAFIQAANESKSYAQLET